MFDKSYERLIKHEGGYVNDPDDKGGETYKGISRRYNPNWEGWKIIDEYKSKGKLSELKNNNELERLTAEFYKKEYWDYFRLDTLPEVIADEIFEQSVNLGKQRTTTFIQITCNILNNNQKLYPNVKVDGKFGDTTYNTLLTCIKNRGTRLVYNILNILQGSHYIEIMLTNETQEKFIGWFSRIDIIKQ
ncbi:MAG: hypothetical protein HPY57_13125 [Ignavibacteria bacterium]|nr:hypothetical protein [Ignavibacteria bacterium]